MIIKTQQGSIKLTKNMNNKILLVVTDNENEQQAYGSLGLEVASDLAYHILNTICEIENGNKAKRNRT